MLQIYYSTGFGCTMKSDLAPYGHYNALCVYDYKRKCLTHKPLAMMLSIFGDKVVDHPVFMIESCTKLFDLRLCINAPEIKRYREYCIEHLDSFRPVRAFSEPYCQLYEQ